MYSYKVKQVVDDALSSYHKMLDMATDTPQKEQPKEEAVKNKWLLAEGFRPVMTPEKEVKWIPKPQHATDAIQNYQKGLNSMSNETLVQAYPFIQYAIDNYIPVVEDLVKKVQNGDHSQQYLNEMILKLMKEGVKEAVEKTGGNGKQGAMQIAKTSSAAQAAMLLSNSTSAAKQLGGDNGD
ncbi:hypothetical protein ZX68_000318 [Salmonella enterica subsp. enterica]|uniref:hypothetical protein n=1 Tax=Salmonella enterica TaxID=28901 RepID=UPI00097364D1|nr:hypothetical protein [Salmonella enterica]EBE2904023.1 hypothetical protein [Salmonella enterica subsp. enterica serovar Krefeld]EDQ2558344.1 hypothetical protein [Salmonella enterica subsp. enterica serovar Langensalza]APY72376.1 hypothetical protein LFZ24_08510 [Salmonella enterica subsp. enterica serovar Krefeld str. SA20030536]EAY9603172.1 hypothetical protein [Salmonella enterica]EBH8892842.1 hypothetical protein [Salmonella enterica subsp. enterica serovar Krefeld]